MSNKNDTKSSKSAPSERLFQVANHVAPRKQRCAAKAKADLPADYSDILGQTESLNAIAQIPDTSKKGYVRQKQVGKLWIRERVFSLLDEVSFHEVGSVSGTVQWNKLEGTKEEPVGFIPSNNVQGFGTLRGRRVVFTADDFSYELGMRMVH